MRIGSLLIEIRFYSVNSLKEKRRIIKSLLDRIKNKFNVSIAEVSENDTYRKAVIGIAAVSNNKIFIDREFSKILNLMENYSDFEIINTSIEFL